MTYNPKLAKAIRMWWKTGQWTPRKQTWWEARKQWTTWFFIGYHQDYPHLDWEGEWHGEWNQ